MSCKDIVNGTFESQICVLKDEISLPGTRIWNNVVTEKSNNPLAMGSAPSSRRAQTCNMRKVRAPVKHSCKRHDLECEKWKENMDQSLTKRSSQH